MSPSRVGWSAAGLTGALALAVYLVTLMPGIGLIDSGELALAAWFPGNAHPPGTPLYVMLGYLVAHIPLGTPALMLNLFSALCTALAAGLIAFSVALDNAAQTEKAQTAPWGQLVGPVAAGLVFASTPAVWYFAVVTEVYALQGALLAGVVAALQGWRATRAERWVYLAALLFGLSVSLHPTTALAFFPLPVLFVLHAEWATVRLWIERVVLRRKMPVPVVRRKKGAGTEEPVVPVRAPYWAFWRMVGLAAVCALAGLLVYVYLPLRALSNPLMNWGDPDQLNTFWWHVSGKWYQIFFQTAAPGTRLVRFAALLNPLSVTFFLACAGAVVLFVRRRYGWLVTLVATVVGNAALFMAYDIEFDKQGYVFPALIALSLLVGPGVHAFMLYALPVRTNPQEAARPNWVLNGVLALGVVLSTFAVAYRAADRSRDHLAEDYARNVLVSMEPNGVLFTAEWEATVSPLLYVHHVLGERPDTTVIDVNLVRRSWYVGYVRQADPALYALVSTEYEKFLHDLAFFENDQCLPPASTLECVTVQTSYETLINVMAARALSAGRPVYVTAEVDTAITQTANPTNYTVVPGGVRVPEGLLFHIYINNTLRGGPGPQLNLRGLNDGTVVLDAESTAAQLPAVYAAMLNARARYLLEIGRDVEGARALSQLVLQIDPNNIEARARVESP